MLRKVRIEDAGDTNMLPGSLVDIFQFERENEDILDAPFTSYGVNGVSMSFGCRLSQVGGVVIPADLYALLCTTGLCYPAV